MIVNPMRLELPRWMHELRRVSAERLSSLLTHLARDETQRLGSGRLVHGAALFAAAIAGGGFDLLATLHRPLPAEDAPASDPGPPDRP